MKQREKVEMFYTELAVLATKYDLEGIVGMWFMADCDLYGTYVGAEINNARMQYVMGGLSQKLRNFNNQVQPEKSNGGEIRVIAIKPRKPKT